jgi:predicted TIM-barrel fold metal-dependent hydrolase
MTVFEAVSKYPEKFVGFVRPNPWYEDSVMDIDFFVGELGFKGIKLHSGMESFPVNARILYPIIEKASKYQIPVLIDGNPALIGDWADEFPEVTFIIPHMAGRNYQTAFFVAKKCENVMLETSVNSWTHRILRQAVDQIGQDRILWGSDTPFHTPEVELKKVEMSKLTSDEKEMILWKNICRLLKLDCKQL